MIRRIFVQIIMFLTRYPDFVVDWFSEEIRHYSISCGIRFQQRDQI